MAKTPLPKKAPQASASRTRSKGILPFLKGLSRTTVLMILAIILLLIGALAIFLLTPKSPTPPPGPVKQVKVPAASVPQLAKLSPPKGFKEDLASAEALSGDQVGLKTDTSLAGDEVAAGLSWSHEVTPSNITAECTNAFNWLSETSKAYNQTALNTSEIQAGIDKCTHSEALQVLSNQTKSQRLGLIPPNSASGYKASAYVGMVNDGKSIKIVAIALAQHTK